ncbi:uncharacterized protein LOC141627497 [Silene latifolia]|uniref:uncharacterized protein LOC141627497 n=1 Tax=Silene latifolia TaxID=37657 RepID=UPI003D76CE62
MSNVKEMTSKFGKLEKFEGVDFRRWQKKMHFLLTTLKVVYVLSAPMPEHRDDETMEEARNRLKWKNDDYICRGHILNGMSDSLFDVYQNYESEKELWNELESKYMAEDASSKKFLFAQHKMEMDESISVSSIIDKLPPSWKYFKHMLKHKKEELSIIQLGGHFRIEESLRAQEGTKGKSKETMEQSSINMMEVDESCTGFKGNKRPMPTLMTKLTRNQRVLVGYVDDEFAWCIDLGATKHVCKDRRWFKTYEPVKDGSILYMGNESITPILGRGVVVLIFSFGKSIHLYDVLHVPGIRKNLVSDGLLSKYGYRQVFESDKYVISKCGLSDGFWGEAMLTACYLLNRVPNKRNNDVTPYELWYTKTPNLNYFRVWGCRAIVRLPEPKIRTLGEKGIECIFIGYDMHCKAYRFYVIESNRSIVVNTVIESRDAILDENRFSSLPRPKDIVSLNNGTNEEDINVEPQNKSPELRRGTRIRKRKSFGPDFQTHFIEGSREEIGCQYEYCYHVDEDP